MAERTGFPNTGTSSPSLGLAFAPVHKVALGGALGSVGGMAVFALTVFHVALQPHPAPAIGLLSQYFQGYQVSWSGAFVGFFWGAVVGFVTGWFVGFVRNVVIAAAIFMLRTKAELAQTRDFLDHI